jgi:hypothetical protein
MMSEERAAARRRARAGSSVDVRVGERVAIGFAHGGGKGSEHDT